MAYSKIILNGETLMDVTSDTVDAGNLLSGKTATKNSGVKVTGNIASKSSSDLTVSGATITAPSGYYSASASKSIASGTEGTPTATKGAVSNHAVTVTPSVTNVGGYIQGGTKTGTAVSVSASELVSGTKTITQNGTSIDVANYEKATVNVSAPSPSLQSKTYNVSSAGTETVTADSGYDGLSEVEVAVPSGSLVSSIEYTDDEPSITVDNNGLVHVSGGFSSTVNPVTASGYIGSASTIEVDVGAVGTYQLTKRTSSDLTVSGATVTAPTGYYPSSATKTIATGTAGTPTASKGTVSNHSVSVTPSVTNTTGYITGGTKTGTAVSVSASELVSGTYTVDSSGTKDVTNYASASISALTLPSTLTNSVTGTSVATLNLPNGVNKYLQIPKGYNNTNSYYQLEVPTGTAGTPTASKGTVSNHAVTVTPSVTNITGYITGGTLTGTGVSVSASELVSGNKSIIANGNNIDVADYSTVSVNVPTGGGASNLVQGTFTTSATEGTTQTVNIPYTGNGYPISLSVFPSEGTYKNGGTAYNTVKQHAVWYFNASKCYPDIAATYDGSNTSDTAMTLARYKNSSSSSSSMSSSAVNNTTVYTQTPGDSSVVQVIKISSATTLSVITASTTYGLLPSTEYTYVMSYSS